MSPTLEPDQSAPLWDHHVAVYEEVFEPFTLALARPALARLQLTPNSRVLDVGAGAGGVAIELAGMGARVTAVDASAAMAARIAERAHTASLAIDARQMDATALDIADATFDAALSVFGIVLAPDAARALTEMRRVVRPGGRVAVVTWTQPERYELSTELMAAIAEVWPDRPRGPLPAQLRFKEEVDFHALFRSAGLGAPVIEIVEAHLQAPSAQWLARRIAFAPGMAANLDRLGGRRADALRAFVRRLEARFGQDGIQLGGRAFVGVAHVN